MYQTCLERLTIQRYKPMTSSGSDLRPSGNCPCKTSNRADNAFVHKIGSIVLLSRINVKTLFKPMPTTCNLEKLVIAVIRIKHMRVTRGHTQQLKVKTRIFLPWVNFV